MPSKPHIRRRRARKVEIRESILDAARSLFAIEGFSAVTMRRIGEHCDYTPSAIYKHFPNKGAILDELRHDALSRLALAITEGVETVSDRWGGPLSALREACGRYLAFAASERQSYVLAFSGASPAEHGGIDPTPVIDAFAELIARGRRSGDISTHDHNLAVVLWHSLHGRAVAPPQTPHDDRSFVEMCMTGLQLGVSPQ